MEPVDHAVQNEGSINLLMDPMLEVKLGHTSFSPPVDDNRVPASNVPRRATCEEVPDEEDPASMNLKHNPETMTRYYESYPAEKKAGATYGQDAPEFQRIHQRLKDEGFEWGPFEDEAEWQLAEWLIKNVSQTQTDAFLKLPIVSHFASGIWC
jgi:hypothetical protein